MQISTNRLRKFFSNASFVPVNKILPICGYLRIGESTIAKNNIHVFYEEHCEEAEGAALLVDSHQLSLLLNNTTAEHITIKPGKLSDGTTTVICDSPNVDEFPITPFAPPEEHVDIPSDVMEAIRIASSFVVNEELKTIRSFIMISNTGVRASDGHVGMGITIDSELPHIVLSKEAARPLQNIQEIKYAEVGSFQLFQTEDAKFGFNKSEFNFLEMSAYFDMEKHRDKSLQEFRVEKEQWIGFNNMAAAAAPDKTNMSSMKFAAGKLCLSMTNSAYKIDIKKGIDGAGPDHKEFWYNPLLMNRLLKAIPDETVWCYRSENCYYITGESGYITLIMKII